MNCVVFFSATSLNDRHIDNTKDIILITFKTLYQSNSNCDECKLCTLDRCRVIEFDKALMARIEISPCPNI